MPDLRVIEGEGEPEPPLRMREKQVHYHRLYVLDHDARRVFCEGCGEEVDAFRVLEELARDDSRWRAARDYAHRAARQEERRLADLKRQVRNAKGRLRRATR